MGKSLALSFFSLYLCTKRCSLDLAIDLPGLLGEGPLEAYKFLQTCELSPQAFMTQAEGQD